MSEWQWTNPSYDAQACVYQAEEEFGKYSLESAKAYEKLYAQACLRDEEVARMTTSRTISEIYQKLYGVTSNHPDLMAAYERRLHSIYKSSIVRLIGKLA